MIGRYCSPTRRSLLTGRLPTSITSVQPDGNKFCSDFLPLATTTLAEKLSRVGYVCHFIGKGHLGYETEDHLPIRRGFASHVGYLDGSEGYAHGGGDAGPVWPRRSAIRNPRTLRGPYDRSSRLVFVPGGIPLCPRNL